VFLNTLVLGLFTNALAIIKPTHFFAFFIALLRLGMMQLSNISRDSLTGHEVLILFQYCSLVHLLKACEGILALGVHSSIPRGSLSLILQLLSPTYIVDHC